MQTPYFVDIDKIILTFIWKDKGSRMANIVLKKKNKVRGIELLDFRLIDLIINTV